MPADLDLPQLAAIGLIFLAWSLYTPVLASIGRGTHNIQLHAVRRHWMHMLFRSPRENRVFDGVMMGHIINSVSFFGSATLIVLASVVGMLAGVNGVYASVGTSRFIAAMSVDLFAIHLAVLAAILAFSFFSFTYAQRKLAYTIAMIGALRDASENTPHCKVMIDQTAIVLTEAVGSINTGIRGFYYAVAALFLFAGPAHAVVMTVLITGVLYYRQKFSPTAIAIARYVDALAKVEKGE